MHPDPPQGPDGGDGGDLGQGLLAGADDGHVMGVGGRQPAARHPGHGAGAHLSQGEGLDDGLELA